MDQDIVPWVRFRGVFQTDLLDNAAEVGLAHPDLRVMSNFNELSRNGQTHNCSPFFFSFRPWQSPRRRKGESSPQFLRRSPSRAKHFSSRLQRGFSQLAFHLRPIL